MRLALYKRKKAGFGKKKPQKTQTQFLVPRIPREVMSYDDFLTLLGCIPYKNAFALHKTRAALVLLYVTGLRCGNLLVLTCGQMEKLLLGQSVSIQLIKKKGLYPHVIRFSRGDLEFLFDYRESIEYLMQGKLYNDYVFAPLSRGQRPFERVSFIRSLNSVCKLASEKLGKKLLTHSFRISFITKALMHSRVEAVQKHVGHSCISATLCYDKRSTSEAQKLDFEQKLDLEKYKRSLPN